MLALWEWQRLAESHGDYQIHWIKKDVLVLYTGMSLMLCAHSFYCDLSQLIVILAFGNVSGLNQLQTFIMCFNLQLNFMIYYIKEAFLLCIIQCATRSKVKYGHIIQNRKNTPCSLWSTYQFPIKYMQSIDPIENKT